MENAQAESNPTEPITNDNINFELSKEFLIELKNNAGHGMFDEDVVDHIAKVLKLLDSIKILGVDSHRLRMKVFPLSLADDARQWYGKIWYDEDVHDLRSVETEFPDIVFNDELSSEKTLSCEPTISSPNNNEIDFRISFDESDDGDYRVSIRRIMGNGYGVLTSCTVLGPRCKEIDKVSEVSIIWNPMCNCSHAGIQMHLQHTSLLINSTWRIYQAYYQRSFSF
ncbi:hypothetical protein Tco_0745444 [Tanacetum coccineum]